MHKEYLGLFKALPSFCRCQLVKVQFQSMVVALPLPCPLLPPNNSAPRASGDRAWNGFHEAERLKGGFSTDLYS